MVLLLAAFAQKKIHKIESNQATRFNFQRTIRLDQDNKEVEIIIEIEKQTKRFDFKIDTYVSSGKLTIEIYDSNNKKQGIFSVGTQLNTQNGEKAEGNINKSLTEPQAGKWKVKIIPINATGMIQINTATFL